MGKTKIEWTADANGNPGFTFNPWSGCDEVSSGCAMCYAKTMAERFPKIHGTWGPNGTRVMRSESYWRQPLKWNRAAEKEGVRKRVFCASMADVFEYLPENNPSAMAVFEARQRLGYLIFDTPNLDWLLLTKRPENVSPFYNGLSRSWPRNAWLGVSVENQEMADKRIPILLDLKRRYDIPVAFLSVEPMLGAVTLDADWILPRCLFCGRHLATQKSKECHNDCGAPQHELQSLVNYVICGGESGHNARPMEMSWALNLRRQCGDAGVPFFFKQGSAANWPDFKNFDSFPPLLRVREFPR